MPDARPLMIVNRRDVAKMLAAMPVALTLPGALESATSRIDLWVRDARYAMAFDCSLASSSLTIVDGNVTPLWTGTLSSAWRKPGGVITGATGSDVLFVLEHLAWGRGRRVTHRQTLLAPCRDRHALVKWVIQPVHASMVA